MFFLTSVLSSGLSKEETLLSSMFRKRQDRDDNKLRFRYTGPPSHFP